MTTTQKRFDDHITQRLREAAGHDQISAGTHCLSTTGLHSLRLMLSASEKPTCRG